jgi:programmed cell death protein 5
MSELDALRQKRMRELQMMQQQANQQTFEQQYQAQQMEEQINLIMRQIMTADARERLANIRMARPDFARQVEIMLIQLYQGGRLKELNDTQFKSLLEKISGTKRQTTIKRG